MLVDRSRRKLFNAIVYFAANTRHFGKEKLDKLLYVLDFEHFKFTGQSVTKLEYRACERGPMPSEYDREWGAFQDLDARCTSHIISDSRKSAYLMMSFDDGDFTNRQMRLLQEISARYEDYQADVIDVTDAGNGAWARVWDGGRGDRQAIPYVLSIPEDAPHRAAILEAAKEYQAMSRRKGDLPRHPR